MKTIRLFLIVMLFTLGLSSAMATPTLPSLNRIKDVRATIEDGVLKEVHFSTHSSNYNTKDAVLQIWEGVDTKMVSETPLYYDTYTNCTCFKSLMDLKLDESKKYTIVIPEGSFVDRSVDKDPNTPDPTYINRTIYNPLPGYEAPSIKLSKWELIQENGLINSVKLSFPKSYNISITNDDVIALEYIQASIVDLSRFFYPKGVSLEKGEEYDVVTIEFEPFKPEMMVYLLVGSDTFSDSEDSSLINWVYYFFVADENLAVDELSIDNQATDAPVHDLSGRRISQPEKGQLYIKEGHKFIAR